MTVASDIYFNVSMNIIEDILCALWCAVYPDSTSDHFIHCKIIITIMQFEPTNVDYKPEGPAF